MHPLFIFACGLAVVLGCILILRLHAFLALLLGTLTVALLTPVEALQAYAAAQGLSDGATAALLNQSIGSRIADGFGRTAGQIGIVIAMASVIGICLLESGAA
ncbi:MAG: GntP family permease, partial [Rhodothermaceae bacterium]|nr:GntP family permease [Rhodothermaceae bacterium]